MPAILSSGFINVLSITKSLSPGICLSIVENVSVENWRKSDTSHDILNQGPERNHRKFDGRIDVRYRDVSKTSSRDILDSLLR